MGEATPGITDGRVRTVAPETALQCIEPGMSIFLGTGVAEPLTLVRALMASTAPNLQDLVLTQLVSFGDAISLEELQSNKYRLRTFYAGWIASEAINSGRVDLIPSRFANIPDLIERGLISFDAAFVQITPPNEAGYCSLGMAVDAARQAIDSADLVIGEINPAVPFTHGDTFVAVSEFDFLVEATEPPIYLPRFPVDEVFDRVAANVASVVEDGSCLAFPPGPVYEALGRHLAHKRNLGIHTPFFTDAAMALVKCGAVTNRKKALFRGRSVASYAFGSQELMKWLDRNPLIEFQGLDRVFNPVRIGSNPRVVSILQARKVDLSGRIALHADRGNVGAGPSEAADFVNGADLSAGGKSVFALPSRNLKGEPTIRLSVEQFPNQFNLRESVDMVATEHGVAQLRGRTVRERALALIEIAHPDDRQDLVDQAKAANIIYRDQIFLVESARLYPADIAISHVFKNDLGVDFRAIKPSDVEDMRRLFYRFSDTAVYYRYFSPIKTMPHAKMQEYVNVDYGRCLSIVGLVEELGEGRIIAEGRFVRDLHRPYAEVAFVVDEAYQGRGIATFMLKMLIRLAKERGLKGFTAEVLSSNKSMLKVFEKGGLPVEARVVEGIYEVTIPFGKNVGNV
ncbi:MAG: GNAT family N-acetyltransferase [Desulfobacterales bacterium]|nr:GNAT family N-acetyltransferase [Desulfobacterales bacterium]MDJ0991738.1 GNAT family N-acetyltransferase [Desulfobacterales bacterium]